MKLKHLIWGALPLLIAGCSSDNLDGSPDGSKNPQSTAGGYIAVNLQLPSQSSTRAGNDNYDDGNIGEYTVNKAAIVIFQGASESDAVIKNAYVLSDYTNVADVDKDNITTQYVKYAKVNAMASAEGQNDHLYALALINYDETLITISDDKKGNKLSVNSVDFTGKKLSDLTSATTDNALYSADNFFMTNAPLSNAPGSVIGAHASVIAPAATNVHTLSQFEFSNIYETEEEAKHNPAANIYVERAVAKATVSIQNGAQSFKIGEKTYTASWEWCVDNTEKNSFIVRNLGTPDYLGYTTDVTNYANYRFVGTQPMGYIPDGTTNDNYYRIYWCVDPTYSKDATATSFYQLPTDYSNEFKSTSTVFYPHENTFDIDHQNYNNTTRAVFRMKLENAGTFYTLNGDETTLYNSEAAVESPIYKYLTDDAPEDGTTPDYPDEGVNGKNADISKAFKDALLENKSFTYTKNNIDLKFERNADGVLALTKITLKVDDNLVKKADENATETNIFKQAPVLDETTETALINYINKTWVILEYQDGYSYYDLRFMHFADEYVYNDKGVATSYGLGELAPWAAGLENPVATHRETTSEAYGTDAANYLGRYGMVRNNWYDVAISGVKKLGSPVPPKVATVTTSDDNTNLEHYLAFKINILSWAKRTQTHTFK